MKTPSLNRPSMVAICRCAVLFVLASGALAARAEVYSNVLNRSLWSGGSTWKGNFTNGAAGGWPVTNDATTIIWLTTGNNSSTTNDYPIVVLNRLVSANSGSSSITLSGGGTLLFTNNADTMPAVSNLTASGYTFTINQALNVTTTTTFRIMNGGFMVVNSNITGLGSLTIKAGTSTMTLRGSNSYSGGTTLDSGRLSVYGGLNLGTGAVSVASGARLQFLNGAAITNFSGPVSGEGVVTLGSSPVYLWTSNSYSGGTLISGGRAALGDDSALGTGPIAFLVSGSGLSSTGSETRTLANSLVFSNNATLGHATDNGRLIFTGGADLGGGTRLLTISNEVVMSGSVSNGGLIKAGSAMLTLSGNNTYSDGTTISNGTLALSGYGSLASAVHIIGGTTLLVTNAISTIGGAVSNSGTISVVNSRAVYSNAVVLKGGRYYSDPSTNTFNGDFAVDASSVVTNAPGDVYAFGADFSMGSTNRAFNMSSARVIFTDADPSLGVTSGLTNHTLNLTGSGSLDMGSNWLNHTELATNFSLGTLIIALNNRLMVTGQVGGGLTNALYVGALDLTAWSTDATSLTNTLQAALFLPDINLYYDKFAPENTYLHGLEFDLWSGGLLIPIPEPAPLAALAAGLTVLVLIRRRRP